MAEHNANQDSPISESLHPLVNMAIIGLVLMFVAAVWMFCDSGPYEAWLDVVVTIRHRHRHSRAVVANLAPERGRREGRQSS
jgi:hypothetical protein